MAHRHALKLATHRKVPSLNKILTKFDDEEFTPRSSPAASDESLREHELHQHIRTVFPDSPESLNGFKPMRVAIVQTAAGLKPPSGGFRGNYATILALQKYGHTTMQFCWAYTKDITTAIAELKAANMYQKGSVIKGTTTMHNTELDKVTVNFWKFTNVHGIVCIALDADVMIKTFPNGLQQLDAAKMIRGEEIPARAAPYVHWIRKNLEDFEPTHVLFNDALANAITSKMPMEFVDKVARVDIFHTFEQLPTGPFAGGISGGAKEPKELELLQDLDGLVAPSRALQKYAKDECGLECEMIPNHAWSYKDKDTGDWPRQRQNFKKQNVVMINPAAVKGYDIFLGMARENKQREVENDWDELLNRPVYTFIAYTSWGSSPEMIRDLKAAGVIVEDPVTDMEPVFDNISVLIVPSLWQEVWGIVATEAQIRGIPVIGSNVGGIPEAKRYVWPLLDVNPINGKARDANGEYIIPPQDHKPWMKELDALLTDKERYVATAHAAYYTTRQWLRDFDIRGMEKYLLTIMK